MDVATKRLLDGILVYLEEAPPNVSNDLLNELKGISEKVMETSSSQDVMTPGRLAVAKAMGQEDPDPLDTSSETVDKSPGQRAAEGLDPSAV